ncbi:MAG: DUF4175 family protein, partial [Gammaproteobacteria bacterium]|nr:DUF4175 family protein [Gammaproteobacteria bacterium]
IGARVEGFAPGEVTLYSRFGEAAANPYRITVEPGDVLVARGAGQLIGARVEGFAPGEVVLYSRFDEADGWQRESMTQGAEEGLFERFLFDLERDGEYYVQADTLRSPSFRIRVAELPTVSRIDLLYHFPPRVGLEPLLQRDTGDIRALPGTRVELEVFPSVPVAAAELVLNGQQRVPLEVDAEGQWHGTLEVQAEGYYHVALKVGDAPLGRGSADYRIEVLPDRAPSARIVRPGRDVQVTSVEEPLIEVRASDDLGVRAVDLVVSVNGGPEQRVSLHQSSERHDEVELSHTLYLEELELAPGDLIAYYARAGDTADADVERAITDLFFMEVRPFTQNFRQGQGQGGGGGMMQGADQGSLSAQQRELVIATFNLSRDRDDYTEDRFDETAGTLARAQARIRDRVVAIVRRLGMRSIMRENEELKSMVQELPKAVEAMREAEAALDARAPDDALPPARKALQHLQRAEAAFRDVRLAFGRGGGQGGSFTNAEDLANLFKLEMDKLRNQYEGVQRGQWQSPQAALDETLRKLKELARRQQREVDRMQRRAEQGLPGGSSQAGGQASGQGGGGAEAQRALAEELEQMARRLERLTREQPDTEMQAMAERLRDAADAMRRAASGEGGDGLDQARTAMEHLREAGRLGEDRGRAAIGRRVHEAEARAERLVEQERQVAAGVRGLPQDPGVRADLVPRLRERKQRMEGEARELESELETLARLAGEQEHEAARELDDAARTARGARAAEKIAQSARALDDAAREQVLRLEEGVAHALESMREGISRAAEAAGGERRDRLAPSLARMREMVRELESLHERTRRNAEGTGGGDGAPSRGGEPGAEPGGQPGRESGRRPGGQPGGPADADGAGQRADSPGAGNPYGRPRGGSLSGQGPWIPRGGATDGQVGGADIADLHREFIARREAIGGLVRELDRQTHGAQDIGALVAELDELGRAELARDPRALLERQAALIEALKRLEFELGEDAGEAEERRGLHVTGNDAVPADYRSLVEEYFRDLSRSDGAAR